LLAISEFYVKIKIVYFGLLNEVLYVYLKNLEIHGFKSFADKITIEFGEGITSIVGPNGSGKSNISDAVRWVMGEQSAKSLRGNKMEDVIFAGTQTRKPLGFAEVSLTIDNSDKILPIEYNEVTVTRRVYRSGESEYYINKSLCRLKDVHELFMDTGLGKEGYSIIGQGRIDEILSIRSEDRRHIFEEAAGITKYRYRKEESSKKLELTQENLTRLKDIISELELQIGPLKQQSEKARKYLDLRESLKILEINVLLDSVEKLKRALNTIEEQYNIIIHQLENDQNALENLEHDLEKYYSQVKSFDDNIDKARTYLYENETNGERIRNEINILKNNIKYNHENLEKLNEEIKGINEKVIMVEDEIGKKQAEVQKLKQSFEELKSSIDKLELQNKDIINAIQSENENIEQLKSDIIEKMNEVSELKEKQNSLKVLESSFRSRKNVIDKELEAKNRQLSELDNTIELLSNEYIAMKQRHQQRKKDLTDLCNKRKEVHVHYEDLNRESNRLVSLEKEKTSRRILLEDMEKDYEGYSKSVKNILLEWKKGQLKSLKIHGPVSQLIQVPKEYIIAIEVALGSAMQNIVVDNEQDAKSAIEFLKRNHLGRATFLPISSVNGKVMEDLDNKIKSFPGYMGVASELIQYESRYRGIMNNLLGRVVVVDHMDTGINMARKFGYKFRIVTLEGEVLNPGGSLTGGSINKVSSFLSRANEIEMLKQDSIRIQKTIQEIDENIEKESCHLQKIEADIADCEHSLKECEETLIKIESDLKHIRATREDTVSVLKALKNENLQVDEQIKDTLNGIDMISGNLNDLNRSIKEMEQKVLTSQESYKSVLNRKEKLSEELVEKKMKLNSMMKDMDLQLERIAGFEKEKQELYKSKAQKENECISLKEKNETMNSQIMEMSRNIRLIEEKINQLKNEIEENLRLKRTAEQNISNCQTAIRQQWERISLVQQEHRNIENKKTRTELELEGAVNKLWEDYGLTYTTAQEYKKEIGNISKAQKEINSLKNQIKELGNINIDAIEEYKNVKERHDFLLMQKNDLEEAKASLTKIIQDMTELMKKQFAEQFKVINTCFNEVFVELFGGGKAELKLTSPEDILESGIEIEVQPPGKRLQNIMLLSGGEKAFTAIALLFAILKVRPTPFCILDEIEAALDDVNVYRFAQYLKKYSKKTQFIIVTHRRGTMEVADVLYGVTMQEHGISKLLSLKIDDIAS